VKSGEQAERIRGAKKISFDDRRRPAEQGKNRSRQEVLLNALF